MGIMVNYIGFRRLGFRVLLRVYSSRTRALLHQEGVCK